MSPTIIQMVNYTKAEAYWKKLASESDRMKLVRIGKTAEGRHQWMVDYFLAGEFQEPRALQGNLAKARARRRTSREAQAHDFVARGQGRRVD